MLFSLNNVINSTYVFSYFCFFLFNLIKSCPMEAKIIAIANYPRNVTVIEANPYNVVTGAISPPKMIIIIE